MMTGGGRWRLLDDFCRGIARRWEISMTPAGACAQTETPAGACAQTETLDDPCRGMRADGDPR